MEFRSGTSACNNMKCDMPTQQSASRAACDAWDKAASRLHEIQARERREISAAHGPQQRKVEVLHDVLRDLKKSEEPGSDAIRDAVEQLEQSQKE